MERPHLAISYRKGLPRELLDSFKTEVETDGLAIRVEATPYSGPYACPEWFVPTIVVAFVAKSYFDGFLKEMGKDHYQLLKRKLSSMANDVMSKPKIEPVIVGTPGKVSSKNPYSLAFSVCAEANDGNTFKLLLPKPSDAHDYTEIIYIFLEFLNEFHQGIKTLESIGFNAQCPAASGYIFVHMNPETKTIEWLNQYDFH